MFGIAFVLFALIQDPNSPAPDEINDALAHAEALYGAAQFAEAITLLTRVDNALSAQPGRLRERLETKLQLGLNSIGLNDTAKARNFFMAIYALDLDYALDTQRFSSKVLTIAEDAKAEQTKLRCYDVQTTARAYLDKGEATAFLKLLQLSASKCPALEAMGPEAAEILYRAGLAAYRRGELSDALSSFETALTLSPEHELARQYAELTHGKLELAEEIKRKPLR